MSNYLEINSDGLAVGGVYQKIPLTDPEDWANWVEVTDGAQVGWTWDASTEAWSSPLTHLVSVEEIRIIRDELLASSDWRASIEDYPHSDLAAWLTYRQALRDFPTNYIPTENPVWPVPPE